jgi:hypothetical protein
LQAVAAFDEIDKRAKSQPTLVKKVGAVVVFDITKDGKFQQSWSKSFFLLYLITKFYLILIYLLAIDGKQGVIYEGKPKEGTTAQVTITVDDNDFIQLALGKANAPAVCI